MWLFDRDRTATIDNLHAKFKTKPEIAEANVAALNAGHAYGETAELPSGVEVYKVPRADVAPGLYRNTTGTEATPMVCWRCPIGGIASDLASYQ